ncbi:TetR/AcrR family transcriptional regulator [Streptomyces sp. VNUA24]|uniref:TetR/AcrR family transcriptional regulator n=1 Tax=Streptomyces sp. VNUA24 TaxID=3031131 RepID=UPI0023B7C6A1|nr:TetR/AcrR family transcriptional regulator [Streptomyces sp. VNUA24]WEH19993.1 TetR/AcrR family transcriptional regulator [Streptomyces sp. VNUA24]
MTHGGSPSRERIVAGAADLISRRGLHAASIRNLAKHAKAPLGSTYHYFPDGKAQLATEAVRYAETAIARALGKALKDGPVDGVRAFLALWRGIVVDSEFRVGCPILAVSVEEPPDGEIPAALSAAAAAFDGWERLLADALGDHGVDPERSAALGALVVASVEGATAMCRAKRSARPLDQVGEQLVALIAEAVEGRD